MRFSGNGSENKNLYKTKCIFCYYVIAALSSTNCAITIITLVILNDLFSFVIFGIRFDTTFWSDVALALQGCGIK